MSKHFKLISQGLLALLLAFIGADYSGQELTTKDGFPMGERRDFIKSCIDASETRLMQINGLSVETKEYCTCMADNLIPELFSWELMEAINEDKLVELFATDKNIAIVMKCLDKHIDIGDDYVLGNSEYPALQKQVAIKTCTEEIMNDPERDEIWTSSTAREYCECTIEKFYSSSNTYKDVKEVADEDSESFNEIAVPCLLEVFDSSPDFQSNNSYVKSDIKGGAHSTSVQLIDYLGQGFKVKITIGNVSKYFIFDTGASDLVITRDFERELLLNGYLKKENYLGKNAYILANGETVNAQMIQINNVTIGDYTLNNVVIAIIDEGSLLCGKSFLDKFRNWEIDARSKTITLYK